MTFIVIDSRRDLVAILVIFFAIGLAHFARAQEHMEFSVLSIEYIGESDKPISPIVISDSKAGAEWCRTTVLKRSESEFTSVHVVSGSLMAKLITDAELYRDMAQQESGKKSKSPEIFSVTLVTPQSRSTALLNTKLGISLVESLKKHCADDESLHSDLSHFQSRILP